MPELIDMVRASAWGQPLQEQPQPEDGKQPAKLTVDELKAVLIEAGVDFDPKARKADLQALFDALPPAGDTGGAQPADDASKPTEPEAEQQPAEGEAPKE